MGAGASASSHEFSSNDKVVIARALGEKYKDLKERNSADDETELFTVLKSTYDTTTQAIVTSKHGSTPALSSHSTATAPATESTDLSSPPTATADSVPESLPESSAAATAIKQPPPPSSSPPAGERSPTRSPPAPRRVRSHKAQSFSAVEVDEDPIDQEDGYEFNIRNSVQIKPGSIPSMISKIEGPGKLLKAKTSSQLLSMVEEGALDDQSKIAQFISQLKAGTVQTKTATEFRQRRLTYSQETVSESPATTEVKHVSPVKPRANRTTIFASSEIGVVREKQPPFPVEALGTYSCHGIEPAPDEEDGIHEKINQDRGCIVYPYNSKRNEALFMVLDGHGEQGDKVSEFVMRQIVVSLEKDPLLQTDPVAALKNAYLTTNTALLVTDIHYMTSGCTCVTLYLKGNTLYVANAGDSRAVMAKKGPPLPNATQSSTHHSPDEAEPPLGECTYNAHDLTHDHKPDDPVEQARIQQWGGYVCPPHEEGLSARVYLDPEFTMIGLAMSRSIGDHAVKNVGVIAEPEVSVVTVDPTEDGFLIMASDGVWEFITSQEAVEIVGGCVQEGISMYDACQELIETAACRWQENEGDYRDDITAIVVKFPLPNFVDATDV